MLQQNIDLLQETLLSGRKLNRDVARSLVGCTIEASSEACGALGLPAGSSWGDVAKTALGLRREAAAAR